MLMHSTSRDRERYKCMICNFTTDRRHNWTRHIKIHDKAKTKTIFKCELCDYETYRQNYLCNGWIYSAHIDYLRGVFFK
nr:unnamed protein product [Callosobruchus analis]